MSEHAEHDAKAPAEPETKAPAESEGDRPDEVKDGGGPAAAASDPPPPEPAPPPADPPPAPAPADAEPASGSPEPGWYPDLDSGDGVTLRYWDGSSWTDHRSAPEGQEPGLGAPVGQFRTTVIPDDERRNILAQQIQMSAARGLRVENQDRFQAILVEGQPVNHVLHAILTVFTCLLWGIVWAVIAATGGEKRHMITVDEYGNVTHQRLGKS